MIGVSLKVEGLTELQDKLAALQNVAHASILAKAMRKAMLPVLEAAMAEAPVDTGELRTDLQLAVRKGRGGHVASVGIRIVGPAASRWHFIEIGVPAHGIAAHPFLRPALDSNAQLVIDIMKRELARDIRRITRNRAKQAKLAAAVFGE